MPHHFLRETCKLCDNPGNEARGLCKKHYAAMRRLNRLNEFPLATFDEAFEAKIQKGDGCWVWKGATNSFGYGLVCMDGGKQVRAHRYAYEFFTGLKIPQGMVVMHICDNPQCCNPAHLKVATKTENNNDRTRKNRTAMGMTHYAARLSTADVEAIRASAESNITLAHRYAVSDSHISNIKRGLSRKLG